MDARVNEIVDLIRRSTGQMAKVTMKRWQAQGTDDHAKEAEIELLLSAGIGQVLQNIVAYGDNEIAQACAHISEKMGVPRPEREWVTVIAIQRKSVEESLSMPYVGADGEEIENRYVQASEKYLETRLSKVKSWSRDSAFLFGIEDIDGETGGVQPGEICVVTGAQGSMKTSFALGGIELALEKGFSVMFVSLDMDAGEVQERRVIRRMRCSQQLYFHFLNSGNDLEIRKAKREIVELDQGKFILHGNDAGQIDIDRVCDLMDWRRPMVLVIDYLTLLKRRRQSDLDCVEECMPKLKEYTQNYGIRTILLSQMGRASKTEQAQGKTGGHSKGGGIVEELAHLEIELIKDASKSVREPEIIATITKNRRGPSGISYSLECEAASYFFTGKSHRVWRESKAPVKPMFTKYKPGGA